MENATTFVRADLYTITLNGGSVLRYSSANMPITFGGVTWNLGPPIEDGGVQSSRGVNGASVDITILGGDGRFLISGVDILDYIEGFGFDGATIRIDRAMAATWSDMLTLGPVGIYCRFSGMFGEAKELGQTQAVVTVNSFMVALQTAFPSEVYQTPCMNTLGDANCGVHLAGLTVAGTAGNGSFVSTVSTFGSSLAKGDGYFTLGVCTFTSGVNAGISRSVKMYDGAYGEVVLSAPLPAAPAFGDTFNITPGCPLTLAACKAFDTPPAGVAAPVLPFQRRFRATPFVPPPTTGLPS